MTYKNGIKEYALTGVMFGVPMGILFGLMHLSLLLGVITGFLCGFLFAFLIFLFVKYQEKKFDKKRTEIAKERKLKEIKNNDLLNQLVEKNPFEIPASMLQAELDGRWNMMAQQFQTTPEQLEKMITASGQTKEAIIKYIVSEFMLNEESATQKVTLYWRK